MEIEKNRNGGNGNGGNGNGGNGNGGNRNRGNGNDNGNGGGNGYNFGGFMSAQECTYQDILKCQPLSFNGTEGVVGALTWWNFYKRTIRIEAAYAMSWAELMKLMTEVYWLRNEVQKMETELWNLVVKGNDLTAYTRRFQELVLLCTRMVPNEEDKVKLSELERYYLRMLLNVVRGVKGFEQLMTVNKRLCATFKETYFAYGLLNDDKEWTHALSKASLWALGPQLRDIFVTMLLFCDVSRPLKL
ncbi:reverse transcriptase domain-containing protein [Tanacetum coccineum]|uniref:Reverse transcriptase domain-containing protein n=1 Tax=Tanacetum coccineum TaxID=301880 RepID=A0ABQ5CQT9_9ASTR